MTARDRLIVTGLSALAVLAAVWLLLVSPERKKAADLGTQVSAASTQLASAESQLASARAAQTRYAAAYASIVSLGKAVPASEEVPSLIYQLAQVANHKNVDFASIVAGSSSGARGAAGAPASGAASAGFSQLPFTFTFEGTYTDLFHLLGQLSGFTVRKASGGLQVSGRLLTIQGAKLAPVATPGATGKTTGRLAGTIAATAYVLPGGQALTGGATAASPTPASSTASQSSSPSAPAVARVTP